ncbi:MFS transporter [Citrobacter sp. Cb008]|jgi:MFS family permease|uniref:MFS transporter n=1 Tax=Citrobacter TaxID=544 RepID=UPI00066B1A46|nr:MULTISPECIES: MFS transporter [Citrobacter]EMC3650408.1 MFS transporter [Citrobacter braakii]KAA0557416.1 MFS transporter [Citrobacter braakii]MDM3366721.1 MFS transporter [Citrobacter sp. Cb005]MDM3370413.1 MFS transporter [Citrobacter sp. Cb008]MDM3397986.1 MFS transporter [Citrobacter sp. Cb016]
MKNTYFSTAIGLYFNYLVHGMGVILMSLNMSSLEQQWHTDAAGVSIVISSLGIGRLSVLLVAGMLSDRYGRRPFIIFGMACYLLFFVGIINTHSIYIAYAFGFLAGMANSFLDAGTYPSLMEAFPRSPGTANILIKAFVSIGQFLLPMIISLLVWAELWFGWSFLVAAAVMLINGVFLFRCRFPAHPGHQAPLKALPVEQKSIQSEHRCSLLDLASYTLYGYIAMATFYLISQWLAQYGQFVAGMSYTLSIKLLSIYTCGSLLCVLITAPLARKTGRATSLLMLYTFISFIALLMVCLHPSIYMVIVFAFVIGFSSAGGVVQIGLTLMAARFPDAKGKATGIYYSAGSIATFTIPLITARLSQTSIAHIMWFDTGIAAVGFLLALFIGYRSRIATKQQLNMATVVK